ncbi:MAG: sigma 54-interacting transcriptional regulator [Bradymonadia bacterium]
MSRGNPPPPFSLGLARALNGSDVVPDLFGRVDELGRLRGLLEETRQTQSGRSALVTGIPGIGKSRLLTEFKRELTARSEVVFEARCQPADGRPYGALTDLLGRGAQLLADLGAPGHHIDHALALIAGQPGPVAHDPEADPVDQRLRFPETLRRAFIELAAVRPVVCLVHDVHHADPATLRVLHYLVENLLADPAFAWITEGLAADQAPAPEQFQGLLVMSFEEGPTTRPLIELSQASSAVAHLALEGLDEAGIRAFLQSDLVVKRVMQATEGVPLALSHLLASIPRQPIDFWAQRLKQAAQAAGPVLDVLAAFNRPVAFEQLRVLLASPEMAAAQLPLLVESGLVKRTLDRGEALFTFVRSDARLTHYRAMSADRRRLVHVHIAEHLSGGAGLGVPAEEVAQHFIAAEVPERALTYALMAADRLEAGQSYARAARLLEQVVDAASGADRLTVLDRLSALYVLTGLYDAGIETTMATTAVDPDALRDPARALHLTRLYLLAGKPRLAAQVVDEAISTGVSVPTARRALWSLAGEAQYLLGAGDEALARCENFDTSSVDRHALSIRNTQGKVFLSREAHERAYELFARNLDDARAIGDATQELKALLNLGVVHLQRGDTEGATEAFEHAQRRAEAHGDLLHLAIALFNLGVLYHRHQRFSQALEGYHRAASAFRKLGEHTKVVSAILNLADLYVTVGDLDRAQRLVAIARTNITMGRGPASTAQVMLLEGDIARAQGQLDLAAARYEEVCQEVERGGHHLRLGQVLWAQAELMLEKGDLTAAGHLLDRAEELPETTRTSSLSARWRMTRGTVFEAMGEPQKALDVLKMACEALEALDDRDVHGQALWRLARARWAVSDRPGTLEALARASEAMQAVASELPDHLKGRYLSSGARKEIREALTRVRAGRAPKAPLKAQPRTEQMPRQSLAFNPAWEGRYPHIIGRADALYSVFNTLDKVSGSSNMVLLRGESGTGKELVAAALHRNSPRHGHPFIKVNCAAFVETLLLSELFGHEKGAFTGAVTRKKGRFELADKGTLFLDEIGDISPNTQVALLRVLQEGVFERVGGSESIQVDVRVICATHRNLEAMVRDGEFRADLYYRLRGVIIELPALRDRQGDIPLLVEHFLNRRVRAGQRPLRFSREGLASLMEHDWPGNIRELENVVRSVALFADGDTIGLGELGELTDIFKPPSEESLLHLDELTHARQTPPPPIPVSAAVEAPSPTPPEGPTGEAEAPSSPSARLVEDWLSQLLEEEGSLSDVKKRIEFEAIARALRSTHGNITRAAEKLGMKRPRLSQIIHGNQALGQLKREVSQS